MKGVLTHANGRCYDCAGLVCGLNWRTCKRLTSALHSVDMVCGLNWRTCKRLNSALHGVYLVCGLNWRTCKRLNSALHSVYLVCGLNWRTCKRLNSALHSVDSMAWSVVLTEGCARDWIQRCTVLTPWGKSQTDSTAGIWTCALW